MTRSQKYNFKCVYNQFGYTMSNSEDFYFEDAHEVKLIDIFEDISLKLKAINKEKYSMIELGSNTCFYSMLFRQIVFPSTTLNILVEPYEKHMKLGKDHFALNNFTGEFIESRIETPDNNWCNIPFSCETTGVDKLLEHYNLDTLDILHCDIDGAEIYALDSARKSLEHKKIQSLFVLCHSDHLHQHCRSVLDNYGYKCIIDNPSRDIGGDSLIVYVLPNL